MSIVDRGSDEVIAQHNIIYNLILWLFTLLGNLEDYNKAIEAILKPLVIFYETRRDRKMNVTKILNQHAL